MTVIGYARVSSEDQRLDRQELGEVDRLFTEKVSGKDRNRPELAHCLAYLRDCDTLRVYSVDRLARSLKDLLDIIDQVTRLGARIEFVKEGLVFDPCSDDPFAKAMLQIVGTFAELERSLIKSRQAEGIAKAKERGGVYTGRAPALTADELTTARARYEMGVPVLRLAKDFGVGETTMRNAVLRRGAYAKASLLDELL